MAKSKSENKSPKKDKLKINNDKKDGSTDKHAVKKPNKEIDQNAKENMKEDTKTEKVETKEQLELHTDKEELSNKDTNTILQDGENDSYNEWIQKLSLLCIWILSMITRLYSLDYPAKIWYYISM